jgi:transmembrane sensor
MTGIGFDSERIDCFYRGEHSDKDATYVDEVFGDSKKEKELEHLLRRQFNELSPEDDPEDKNLDHLLYRIHYEINTQLSERKGRTFYKVLKWTLRIAGVILLPLLIFIGIQTYNDIFLTKETWVEIKAPAWTRAQFCLPDGTTGWLNSNSSIRYRGNFITDREVTLTGEAFFDVFKNTNSPFRVSTDEIHVEVSGTRFNIASYANENSVEVVLEEGKLEFNSADLNKSYTMNPNDLVVYDKRLKIISTEVVQPQKYLSWTDGKLVFRNDPLDVIARRLERWYNVDVEISGSFSEDLRLRATFIDESLEEVLALLKRSLAVDYKIEDGSIKSDETYAKKKVIITSGRK